MHRWIPQQHRECLSSTYSPHLPSLKWKLIQDRTKAGLSAARARGRLGGRKKMLAADPKIQTAKKMHKDHDMSIDNICRTLKISRATLYRHLSVVDE